VLIPFPADAMRGWPISPRVNSPKNYDPDLLSPVEVRQISQSFIHVVTRWRSLREYSDIHGSARWAKRSDIKQAGLINQEGVYVGEWKNGSKIYTLRHNGPEHVLCYAPPRSGKGVGLVVPTMLTWPHSAVVTDLKREIYELTAGWRGTEGNNRIFFLTRGVYGMFPIMLVSGCEPTCFSTSIQTLSRSSPIFCSTLTATPCPSLISPSKRCSVPT